ncbi:ABC transporter ATP-binding protein [Rossellomorea sp. LjRoot5]|uniref:ABC transporter ATP-binding protein n=1 Tax=Rossellomorea sp. LjRoot5 TaxID=3342331 RepID=UPI003ED07ECF
MAIIEVADIEKNYGNHQVIKGIDVSIDEGKVFGLLGPNGAGKTTLISMLSAQLPVTSGNVMIAGMNLDKNVKEIKKLIGIVPQDIALYPELNAVDNLTFFGALYGLKRKELKERVNWILQMVGLEDRASEPVKNYSGGMKRRINIAAALLHDPRIVFMDEPTVGIDPQSRNKIYELIELLKQEKKTIIYTTHYMEEAAVLCDTIAILDDGQIIEHGTTEELLKQLHGGILELHIDGDMVREEVQSLVVQDDCVIECIQTKDKLSFLVTDAQEALEVIMGSLNSKGIKVSSVNTMPPTLETLFLHLTGKELRE